MSRRGSQTVTAASAWGVWAAVAVWETSHRTTLRYDRCCMGRDIAWMSHSQASCCSGGSCSWNRSCSRRRCNSQMEVLVAWAWAVWAVWAV